MSEDIRVDRERILRLVDEETQNARNSDGAKDFDQQDHLQLKANGTLRQLIGAARNDGEDGDLIPLLLTAIPNFITGPYVEFDDFDVFDSTATTGRWIVTQATAGTGARIDGHGGILQLDSDSSTADQGIQAQRTTETIKLAAGKKVVFAARAKVTDLANNAQIFLGLGIKDTTFMAAGVVSASDYIGFFQDVNVIAGTGDYTASTLAFGLYDGVTLEEVKAAAPMVEDTYFICGFIVDGVTTATPFTVTSAGVVSLGTAITIADPPDTELSVTFVCQSEGTVDPIMLVDWYYLFATR